jgi:hypothetical protein
VGQPDEPPFVTRRVTAAPHAVVWAGRRQGSEGRNPVLAGRPWDFRDLASALQMATCTQHKEVLLKVKTTVKAGSGNFMFNLQ